MKFLLTVTSGTKDNEVIFFVRFLNPQPCEDITTGYFFCSDTRHRSLVCELSEGR